MAIKNYTTKVPAVQTIGEIQGLLAAHGARKVMMDYDEGKVTAVTFALQAGDVLQGYRLDARPNGVLAAMEKDRMRCDEVQAENIAWRNVKDWIAAQIALVETEQATMEELFLPMMTGKTGETLYEVFQSGRLLPGGGV